MKEKEEYAKLIKDFNEINVKSICEELGINHKNVYSGKTSLSNLLIIYGMLLYKAELCVLKNRYKVVLDEYNKKKVEVLKDD